MPCSCRLCSSCFPSPFPALTYSWPLPLPFPDSIFSLPLFRFTFSLLVSSESCWSSPEMLGTVFLYGKLTGQQVDAFSLPAGSKKSSLVYLLYKLSSWCFLVASEASVLLFPAPASSTSSGVKLLTADSSSVLCSGSRIVPLRFGYCSFDWMLQLAPVSVPILGGDFLHHHNLLLNRANQKVYSNSSPGSPAFSLTSSPPPSSSSHRASLLSTSKCVSDLLLEFPDVLSSDGFTASPPCHPVLYHLLTMPGPPVFVKSCHLDPDKLATAKAEFSVMEKASIIRCSTSPWISPLHMVKKKDGGWRPCDDYWWLNTVTVPDRYLLLSIADFTSRTIGSTVFSKLDLQKGYN